LLFIYNEVYIEAHSYTVNFASRDNPLFAQYMLNRIEELKNNNSGNNYSVGSITTGLKLLQYVFARPPLVMTTIKDSEIVLNITKSITLINQNNINDSNSENKGVNHDSIFTSIQENGGSEEYLGAKNLFCNQVVYSDFVNYPLRHLAIGQILKADKFFKFCETNPKFKTLTTLFLHEYGCKNVKTYLESIMRLIGIVLESSKSKGYPIIKVPRGETFGLQLLNSISLNKNEVLPMISNYDSLDFRNKPLIKRSDDEFYIINKSFVIERLYNCIKFNLNTINTAMDPYPMKRIMSDVFSDFTTLFSEGFLFKKTIESIYRAYNYKLIVGGAGQCDYFVQSGNKIFLFENKDIEYASDVKQSDNFNYIKDYIWKKLVSKNGRPIGAQQNLA